MTTYIRRNWRWRDFANLGSRPNSRGRVTAISARSCFISVAFGYFCLSTCSVRPGSASEIELRPPPGLSNRLSYEEGNKRITVWNCDFIAEDVNTLDARVLCFKGAVCTVLGELSVPLFERSPGTVYFPWHQLHGADEECVGQPYFPAIGVAADDITRSAPLKRVTLAPDVSLEYSLDTAPTVKRRIGAKSEEAVWLFVFSKPPPPPPRPLRVDEIVKPSPFDDTEFKLDAIRKAAARIPDSTVIVVTLRAE